MTIEFPLCQSGIVFPFKSHPAAEVAVALLCDVFARRGMAPTMAVDGDDILFQTSEVTLRLHLVEDRARLRLTRVGAEAGLSEAAAQALLAALTAALVRGFAAETVLWLRKDAVLPAARFVAAVDPVRPRRVQGAAQARRARPLRHGAAMSEAWADGFEADQQVALAQMLREAADADLDALRPPRPSVAVRLTAAMVTLFVGLFSLPMAAALLVWNTLRGGDLRASTSLLTAMALLTLLAQTAAPDLAYAMVMTPVALGL